MKDEVAQSLREKYEEKKEDIEFYTKVKKEQKSLEEFLKNFHVVERYIELTRMLKRTKIDLKRDWTDSEILKSVIKPWCLTSQMDYEDENGLWVCLGTYKYDIDTLVQTNRDDPKARFRKYLYLEATTDYTITLDINESKDFEQQHTIVFLKKNNEEEFYKLQRRYIEKAVLESPAKAKKHILNSTRKNRKI